MALPMETKAQGQVIATSPAITPLRVILASGFLNIHQAVSMAPIAAAAAAMLVVAAICAISGIAPMVLEESLKIYLSPKEREKNSAEKSSQETSNG